jgi:hypothetical protein
MGMLDTPDRARPIMEYVRTLETKVRRYQNEERDFRLRWFSYGLLAGGAFFAAGDLLLRLLHR